MKVQKEKLNRLDRSTEQNQKQNTLLYGNLNFDNFTSDVNKTKIFRMKKNPFAVRKRA